MLKGRCCMEETEKNVISAAFDAGMQALAACTEPELKFGPPSSMQTQSG